jgi:hypothetical protein
MAYLFSLHSFVRWLLLLVAVIALVKFALGWWQKKPFAKMDRGLQSGLSGLLDTQWLLGLIYFVVTGLGWLGSPAVGFSRPRLEHFVAMTVAVVVGHLPAAWKNKPDATRFRNNLWVVIAVIILILLGVSVLPGNRWK